MCGLIVGGLGECVGDRAEHQIVVRVAAVRFERVEVDPIAPLADFAAGIDVRQDVNLHVVLHHSREDLAELVLQFAAHGVVERFICVAAAGRSAKAFDSQVLGQIDEDRHDDIDAPFAALGGCIDGLAAFRRVAARRR